MRLAKAMSQPRTEASAVSSNCSLERTGCGPIPGAKGEEVNDGLNSCRRFGMAIRLCEADLEVQALPGFEPTTEVVRDKNAAAPIYANDVVIIGGQQVRVGRGALGDRTLIVTRGDVGGAIAFPLRH